MSQNEQFPHEILESLQQQFKGIAKEVREYFDENPGERSPEVESALQNVEKSLNNLGNLEGGEKK